MNYGGNGYVSNTLTNFGLETIDHMRAHLPYHRPRRAIEPQTTGRRPGGPNIPLRHQ